MIVIRILNLVKQRDVTCSAAVFNLDTLFYVDTYSKIQTNMNYQKSWTLKRFFLLTLDYQKI